MWCESCLTTCEASLAYEVTLCETCQKSWPTREQSDAIRAEYKARFAELTASLGRPPTSEEQRPLSDWYRRQYLAFKGLDENFRPLKKSERPDTDRRRETPDERHRRELGLVCKHGHDLTKPLPNGKPAIYLSPKGEQSCRWCKKDAAERHKAKSAAKTREGANA